MFQLGASSRSAMFARGGTKTRLARLLDSYVCPLSARLANLQICHGRNLRADACKIPTHLMPPAGRLSLLLFGTASQIIK